MHDKVKMFGNDETEQIWSFDLKVVEPCADLSSTTGAWWHETAAFSQVDSFFT